MSHGLSAIAELLVCCVCIQSENQQTQGPSHPPQNPAVPFIWYMTPEDEVTSVIDECGRWQDERTALSNTLVNDVDVDDKGEDDVLCDLLSRHSNDVSSRMFEDAGEGVHVQHLDGFQRLNSWNQETDNSTGLNNPGVEKSCACDVCHKTFRSSSSLVSRKLIRSGERLHVCDVCAKMFNDYRNLSKHKQTHTGDKPHTSDVRHKQFSQRGKLKRHMCTHTAERPHKCSICTKAFISSSHLSRHELIHTGDKPYACLCDLLNMAILRSTCLHTLVKGHTSVVFLQTRLFHPAISLDTNLYIQVINCLLYTSPSPRDRQKSRMPSSA